MKVFQFHYIDLIEYSKAAHDPLERLDRKLSHGNIWSAHDEGTGAASPNWEKATSLWEFTPIAMDLFRRLGISVTEQEYLHAKSKDKPVYALL